MKILQRFALVAGLWLTLALAPAQADVLATDALGAAPRPAAILDHDAARAQVLDQLIAGGVDAARARERVAAMTDAQVRTLAGQMGELPAGAGVSTTNLLLIIIILILLL